MVITLAGLWLQGRQGIIVNVFTEPQWRKRGVAGLLIKEITIWSKNEQINRLILHASDEGRSVYERLGFVASNEMRFAGDLCAPARQAPITRLMIGPERIDKIIT